MNFNGLNGYKFDDVMYFGDIQKTSVKDQVLKKAKTCMNPECYGTNVNARKRPIMFVSNRCWKCGLISWLAEGV